MAKVTVLLAAYNEESNITGCLESLNRQSFRDFDLIFINDGSHDDTLNLATEFLSQTQLRYKIINFGTNRGKIRALNEAIKFAEGRYVGLMDADDTMVRNRLALQVDFLDRTPACDIVGGAQLVKFEDRQSKLQPPKSHPQIVTSLLTTTTMLNPTVMFRNNNVYQKRKFLDAGAYLSEDYRFFVDAVVDEKKFANLQDILCDYNFSEMKAWQKQDKKMRHSLIEIFKIYLRHRLVSASVERLETLFKINTQSELTFFDLRVFLLLQLDILKNNLFKMDFSVKIWFLQCVRAFLQYWKNNT